MVRELAEKTEEQPFDMMESYEPVTALTLSEMVKDTCWLWPGWLACGHITVLAGETGVGKSWLALALAKVAAHGLPWPDGFPGVEGRGPVLWVEAEGRHALLLERAERLGMNPERLCFMEEPLRRYYLDDDEDLTDVRCMTIRLQPCLIVIDCWSKSLSGAESNPKVRFCLDELQELAGEDNVPILLVHHLRKRQCLDTHETFDFDRLRGSSILAQIASCVIGVDRPLRSSNRLRVTCGKANLGALPEPFGFTITDEGLTFWAAPEPQTHLSRLEEAEAFLRRALADGARPATEVTAEARDEGIAGITLARARPGVCVTRRQGPHWLWALPHIVDDLDVLDRVDLRLPCQDDQSNQPA